MSSPSPLLRVAIDATPLLGHLTGIGVFTKELLRHLPKYGVTPVAYATSWSGRSELGSKLPPQVKWSKRPQAARPLRKLWAERDWPGIEWWCGNVDLVHGTNFVVPPARTAGSLLSIHDLTFLHYPEMSQGATLEYPALIKAALARGSWVHCDSTFVAAEVVEAFDADAERVVTIPLGVNPPGPGEPSLGWYLAGTRRYILALGTVEPRKDLPLLVEAFDQIADSDGEVGLVIAGPDGWGSDTLARAINHSQHRHRIRRLGWVSEIERSALLRGASVLAYPSRYEGFGFPPLEAMAVGTPVVATSVGSLPEVLGEAALLVAPHDVSALGEALNRALNSTEVRGRLISSGKVQAQRYSWDETARRFRDLYLQIKQSRSH